MLGRLSVPARRLLLIYLLYSSLFSLSVTFSSAFIWRYTQSLSLVILYSVAYITGVSLAHIVNGRIIEKFRMGKILYISLLMNVLSLAVFYFFDRNLSPALCLIIGLLVGFPGGFFWANRNYLSFLNTHRGNRRVFSFLEQITIMIGGATSMFVFGALIGLADQFIHAQAGYFTSAGLLIFLILICWRLILRSDFVSPTFGRYFFVGFIPSWNRQRMLSVLVGLYDAAFNLLIPILILSMIGNESILGTIEFVSLVLSTILSYLLAGYLKNNRFIFFVPLVTMMVSGLVLGASFKYWSVYICQATFILMNPVIQASFREKVLESSAHAMKIEGRPPYTYVVDNELFLNLGRTLFFAVAFVIIRNLGRDWVLQYGLIIGVASSLLIYLTYYLLSSRKKSSYPLVKRSRSKISV